ncbi:MAG: hypothetical protein ACD_48C00414G0002 [uncultured bacterium]|nr:MAG: hypothetical protein ACD_48C00414G0002 [uncultured bacterium]
MLEYFFPYENQGYQLHLENVPLPHPENRSKMKYIYQQIVPAEIRENLWLYRHHQHISYPAKIEMNLDDTRTQFIAYTRGDETRILTNGHEHDYQLAASKHIKYGDVIWDIGAYQGTWTIPLAAIHKENTFYCFEPDPKYFDILQKNLQLNNLNTVYAYPYAISNTSGNQELYLHSQFNHCSALRQLYPKQTAQAVRVQTKTIDNCVSTYLIPPPDILKIEVEGAENMVLQGMRSIHPRHIFLEIHTPEFLEKYDTDPISIYNEMKQQGYKAKDIWMRTTALLCHFEQAQ